MVPSDDEPKPRIIIDEDWKSQVEREKNAARQQPPEQAADSLQADPEAVSYTHLTLPTKA